MAMKNPWAIPGLTASYADPEDELDALFGIDRSALVSEMNQPPAFSDATPPAVMKAAEKIKKAADAAKKLTTKKAPKQPPQTELPSQTVSELNPPPVVEVSDIPIVDDGLKPVAAGSGETVGKGRDTTRRTLETTSKASMMTPDDWSQAIENATNTESYKAQERGITGLEDMYKQILAMPVRADYTAPLANLTDALTGSKMSAGIQKQEKPTDRLLAAANYAQKVQDDRRDLYKGALDAVGKQKAGTNTLTEMLLELERQKQEFTDPNRYKNAGRAGSDAQTRVIETEFSNKMDKKMEAFDQRAEQLQNLYDALQSNNYQKVQATLSIIAKNIGADSGMLSNQDIGRTLPRTWGSDLASFEAYFTNNPNAVMDPKIAKGLRELASTAFTNATTRYGDAINRTKLDFLSRTTVKNRGLGKAIEAQAKPYEDRVQQLREFSATLGPMGYKNKEVPKDKVRVKSPDGQVGLIPKANLEKAKAKGYTEVK